WLVLGETESSDSGDFAVTLFFSQTSFKVMQSSLIRLMAAVAKWSVEGSMEVEEAVRVLREGLEALAALMCSKSKLLAEMLLPFWLTDRLCAPSLGPALADLLEVALREHSAALLLPQLPSVMSLLLMAVEKDAESAALLAELLPALRAADVPSTDKWAALVPGASKDHHADDGDGDDDYHHHRHANVVIVIATITITITITIIIIIIIVAASVIVPNSSSSSSSSSSSCCLLLVITQVHLMARASEFQDSEKAQFLKELLAKSTGRHRVLGHLSMASGKIGEEAGKCFKGRIKSYQPGNGYGFIECPETYQDFGRDVYLSRQQLEQLRITTIPSNTDVAFKVYVRDGKPQAYDLELLCHPRDGRGSGYSAPFGPEAGFELRAKQCEHALNRFADCLRTLSESLDLHGLGQQSRRALQEADAVLHCEECRRDEQTQGSKILLLLEQARQKWDDGNNLCHRALRNALKQRLEAPAEPVEMPISRLRFTQASHSKRFLHGPHAGQRIESLTRQLLRGQTALDDPSMLLNVVYFHGSYRSLNNRHLTAIVKYAEEMETQSRLPKKCHVRVWPLVRGLRMIYEDGSEQEVIRKFLRSNDSVSDGLSITCKRRAGRQTAVNQEVCVHLSNLDVKVEERELYWHLREGLQDFNKYNKVTIARRPDGRSNCHGWVMLENLEEAERLLKADVPPLRGRPLKMRLDNVSATKLQGSSGSGWVRCRNCQEACAPLLDVLLVEDVRLRRDAVSARYFDEVPTFFCIGKEDSLQNCDVISPHPDSAEMSFKLSLIRCKCQMDLGNIQKASRMQGNVGELLGERVVHFKCASLLLELSDRQDLLLEVRKWQYLAQATGRESPYRLSQLTMSEAIDSLGLSLNSKVPARAFFVPQNDEVELWQFFLGAGSSSWRLLLRALETFGEVELLQELLLSAGLQKTLKGAKVSEKEASLASALGALIAFAVLGGDEGGEEEMPMLDPVFQISTRVKSLAALPTPLESAPNPLRRRPVFGRTRARPVAEAPREVLLLCAFCNTTESESLRGSRPCCPRCGAELLSADLSVPHLQSLRRPAAKRGRWLRQPQDFMSLVVKLRRLAAGIRCRD
ncbi:unnamed protein product, partial [Symbiodinium necroappetens]